MPGEALNELAPIQRRLSRFGAGIRETWLQADRTARALTFATATTQLGSGAFYAISAIFFSQVIGLRAAQISFGLACAGIAGVLGALTGGYVAARVGSRATLLVSLLILGPTIACYTLANGELSFVLLASSISIIRGSASTARTALIASVYTGAERVGLRARLRVVTNIAVGLGAVLAGIALAVGTRTAFSTAVVLVGVLTLLSALPMLGGGIRDDRVHRPRTGTGRRKARSTGQSPFADPRYLGVTLLVGINAMYFALIDFGVPLWVTQHTAAPRAIVSILIATNTAVVVLTQVAASRGTHELIGAGRAAFRGASLIAIACLVFAGSGRGGAVPAVILLFVAVLVMSGGEALGEAGSWGLTMEMANPNNQARYQGVAEMAYTGGQTLGPLVISATALSFGGWGWAGLAAMFALSGLGLQVLARQGARQAAGQRWTSQPG
ncbi:MAG: MFS transporter [Jatrophihabitantaceae bacterium]